MSFGPNCESDENCILELISGFYVIEPFKLNGI
jgi:hypothetical protein